MITDIAIGALAWFAFLVLQKTILEPLATSLGRAVIEPYIENCCILLDDAVDRMGLDFDAEAMLRQYLEIQPTRFSEKDLDALLDRIFREWDLRQACRNHGVD